MKKNLISIIIPYHRKKKYFQQTINSIKKQTYSLIELIVIYDDNSKSELKFVEKAIKKFKKKKLIINKSTLGAGLSRNKGLKRATGEYIAFCDADDLWKKTKLETQLKFMKLNKLSFSHSSYDIIDHKGNFISRFVVREKIFYKDLLKSCDIGLSTVMCQKKILKNCKFLDTSTKEDYYLWLEMIKKSKVFFGIKKELVLWRKLETSLSSSISRRLIDAYFMYQKHTKGLIFKPIIYTFRLTFYALIKKIKIYR